MSTLSVLAYNVGTKVGDPSGTRWAQTISATPTWASNPVQMALNDAQDEFCLKTGIVRDVLDVPVFAGNNAVRFRDTQGNPPLGAILLFEDDRGVKLWKATEGKMRVLVGPTWKGTAGNPGLSDQPKYWVPGVDGNGRSWLYPCPNRTMTFKAYVAAKPRPMLESGALPFINNLPNLEAAQPQYHEAIVYGASERLQMQNQDGLNVGLAKEHRARFEEFATQAAADVLAMLGG